MFIFCNLPEIELGFGMSQVAQAIDQMFQSLRNSIDGVRSNHGSPIPNDAARSWTKRGNGL